jgi:hypothetical protein
MAPKSCNLKQIFFAFDFFYTCGHRILDYASPAYVKIEDHDSPSDISFLIDRRMKGCATFEAIWILWLQQHLAGIDVYWGVGRGGVHPFLLHYILGVQ